MTMKLCTLGNAGKSIATGQILKGLAGLKNGCAVIALLVTVLIITMIVVQTSDRWRVASVWFELLDLPRQPDLSRGVTSTGK